MILILTGTAGSGNHDGGSVVVVPLQDFLASQTVTITAKYLPYGLQYR